MVNKRVQNAVLGCILKNDNLYSFPRQIIQYHCNTSLCPDQKCWRGWSWMFLWKPTRPFRTLKERCPFSYRDWNAKVGTQETLGVTGKFGLGEQNEAGQRLTELCQENALVIANTLFQKHKRRLYTWTSPDGQHQNQTDYIICSQRGRSSIQSAKTRLGADCGSSRAVYCQIQM